MLAREEGEVGGVGTTIPRAEPAAPQEPGGAVKPKRGEHDQLSSLARRAIASDTGGRTWHFPPDVKSRPLRKSCYASCAV